MLSNSTDLVKVLFPIYFGLLGSIQHLHSFCEVGLESIVNQSKPEKPEPHSLLVDSWMRFNQPVSLTGRLGSTISCTPVVGCPKHGKINSWPVDFPWSAVLSAPCREHCCTEKHRSIESRLIPIVLCLDTDVYFLQKVDFSRLRLRKVSTFAFSYQKNEKKQSQI